MKMVVVRKSSDLILLPEVLHVWKGTINLSDSPKTFTVQSNKSNIDRGNGEKSDNCFCVL